MFDAQVTFPTGQAGGQMTTYTMTNLGPQGAVQTVDVNGAPPIRFSDIGNKPLGPNKETWGILISFGDSTWAFRHEGQGSVTIDVSGDTLNFIQKNGSIAKLT